MRQAGRGRQGEAGRARQAGRGREGQEHTWRTRLKGTSHTDITQICSQ